MPRPRGLLPASDQPFPPVAPVVVRPSQAFFNAAPLVVQQSRAAKGVEARATALNDPELLDKWLHDQIASLGHCWQLDRPADASIASGLSRLRRIQSSVFKLLTASNDLRDSLIEIQRASAQFYSSLQFANASCSSAVPQRCAAAAAALPPLNVVRTEPHRNHRRGSERDVMDRPTMMTMLGGLFPSADVPPSRATERQMAMTPEPPLDLDKFVD